MIMITIRKDAYNTTSFILLNSFNEANNLYEQNTFQLITHKLKSPNS